MSTQATCLTGLLCEWHRRSLRINWPGFRGALQRVSTYRIGGGKGMEETLICVANEDTDPTCFGGGRGFDRRCRGRNGSGSRGCVDGSRSGI